MKKRGRKVRFLSGIFIVFLWLALFLPFASAVMGLSGITKERYNIGDKIAVSGTVTEQDGLSGYVEVGLVCNGITYNFQSVPVNLNAGEQKSLGTINIVISEGMAGICFVKTSLISNGLVIDTASSKTFEASLELKGEFRSQSNKVQVGDNIVITGDIKKLDGSPVEGSAEVYFEQGSLKYLMDVVRVSGGLMSFNHKLSSANSGSYKVNIVIRDVYGNKMGFDDIAGFEVVSLIDVTLSLKQESAEPSEEVKISGEAKLLTGAGVAQGSAVIMIGSLRYSTSVSNGAYSYGVKIPNNMKSGVHAVYVSVEDAEGNKGSAEGQLSVKAIPTSLQAGINPSVVYPSGSLAVTSSLYDQAGDVMDGEILIEIKNPDKDEALSKSAKSGEAFNFALEQYAVPGEWKVKAEFGKLKSETIFTVPEVKELSISLQNTTLIFVNIGNIKYKDTIYIYATSNTSNYTIKKTKNIDVAEQMPVELSKELPTGIYDITIPLEDGTVVFEDVVIANGTIRLGLNWAYFVIVLAIAVWIGYLVYRKWRKKPRIKGRHKPSEQKLAKKARERIKEINAGSKESEAGGMEDFKRRTLEEIKRTEEKQRQNRFMGFGSGRFDDASQTKSSNVENKGKNAFTMFD
ncbi:hypothetical protein HZB88_05535 [archaeon]|nr:hypothetical protein [archaeon]